MKDQSLAVFFDQKVLEMKTPDGCFEKAASPLLEYQMMFTESPERIANIKSVLERAPSKGRFDWYEGREAAEDEILLFHTAGYLEALKHWDIDGKWVSATTYLPRAGLTGVKAGAGTTLEALQAIIDGKVDKAYALVRPPSHHAAPAVADGYCFLNCVGMAVQKALDSGYQKIATVDWDVHHGNGTQQGFYHRDEVLTISLHMDHGAWGITHPQTGGVDEVGDGRGLGFNLNLPLPMGSGDALYKSIVADIVVPKLRQFKPDLIVVSNGHDASQFDPNGRQSVTMQGFHDMARMVGDAAGELCQGRLLAVQEGGYNMAYIGYCAYASALGFIGAELDLDDPLAYYPDDIEDARQAFQKLREAHPLLDS